MVNIAVLGFGVVGSGVVEVLDKNSASITQRAGQEINVKKILDIRDFNDSPYHALFTKDIKDILDDDSISIVVETIGVLNVSYEYTKRALEMGKHVVTSNKELVATYGPELLQLARENKVYYLFEGSVGGGIPIIRPLDQCLAANEIYSIKGILNGTTNYILTQMKRERKDFNEALKEAQQKGYAEANPAADIEGHDTCRKIAILSSIAYNQYVDYRNIFTEGITKISYTDMEYAEAMGCVIKLLAVSKRMDGRVYARVSPVLISREHPLANVEDVFNAILVEGNAIGEAMFYGRGAGKLPTASAVVADVIDIVKHTEYKPRYIWNRETADNVADIGESNARFFVRVAGSSVDELKRQVERIFGEVEYVALNNPGLISEVGFKTACKKEKEIVSELESLKSIGICVVNAIRFED